MKQIAEVEGFIGLKHVLRIYKGMTRFVSIYVKLVKLWVDVGELASGYTKPGQFMQLKVGESSPAFIALASPPDTSSSVVELLIKNAGGTSEALVGLAKGDSVSTSAVMGKGFPVDKIPPKSAQMLFMFATGTGISPVKALIESGTLQARTTEGLMHLLEEEKLTDVAGKL